MSVLEGFKVPTNQHVDTVKKDTVNSIKTLRLVKRGLMFKGVIK